MAVTATKLADPKHDLRELLREKDGTTFRDDQYICMPETEESLKLHESSRVQKRILCPSVKAKYETVAALFLNHPDFRRFYLSAAELAKETKKVCPFPPPFPFSLLWFVCFFFLAN